MFPTGLLLAVALYAAQTDAIGEVCKAGYTLNNRYKKCYRFHDEHKTWREAKEACQKLNTRLVVYETLQENQDVKRELAPGRMYWMGLHRSFDTSDKTYVWLSGRKLGYNNWARGEPNDVEHKGHECVRDNYDKKFDDHWCDNQHAFICEYYSGPERFQSVELKKDKKSNYYIDVTMIAELSEYVQDVYIQLLRVLAQVKSSEWTEPLTQKRIVRYEQIDGRRMRLYLRLSDYYINKPYSLVVVEGAYESPVISGTFSFKEIPKPENVELEYYHGPSGKVEEVYLSWSKPTNPEIMVTQYAIKVDVKEGTIRYEYVTGGKDHFRYSLHLDSYQEFDVGIQAFNGLEKSGFVTLHGKLQDVPQDYYVEVSRLSAASKSDTVILWTAGRVKQEYHLRLASWHVLAEAYYMDLKMAQFVGAQPKRLPTGTVYTKARTPSKPLAPGVYYVVVDWHSDSKQRHYSKPITVDLTDGTPDRVFDLHIEVSVGAVFVSWPFIYSPNNTMPAGYAIYQPLFRNRVIKVPANATYYRVNVIMFMNSPDRANGCIHFNGCPLHIKAYNRNGESGKAEDVYMKVYGTEGLRSPIDVAVYTPGLAVDTIRYKRSKHETTRLECYEVYSTTEANPYTVEYRKLRVQQKKFDEEGSVLVKLQPDQMQVGFMYWFMFVNPCNDGRLLTSFPFYHNRNPLGPSPVPGGSRPTVPFSRGHCESGYLYLSTYRKCYKFHNEQKSWYDASATCERMQTRLVTYETLQENTDVRGITGDQVYWIGLRRSFVSSNKEFAWLSGRKLNYNNWAHGEPNGLEEKGTECVRDNYYYASGKYDDHNCANNHYFVCEYPVAAHTHPSARNLVNSDDRWDYMRLPLQFEVVATTPRTHRSKRRTGLNETDLATTSPNSTDIDRWLNIISAIGTSHGAHKIARLQK